MSETPPVPPPTLPDARSTSGPQRPVEPAGMPFGRYQLLQRLGQGGMGVVWKAYDTQLKRVVALKQILRDREDPATAERFLREAQAAARLRHPNIIGVYEAGVIEGHHYLTAEYVEGKALRDVMPAGPMPARETVEMMRHIADAVAYAHAQGIVHRDLKPENILIDATGKPHVMDFGLAKDVKEELGRNLTQTGQVMGTVGYMSPEQASGCTDDLGPSTDQFALGTMLFELLTGALPFQCGNYAEFLDAVRGDDPARPSRLNPQVSRDVETICLKALEKDPRRRYASMADFAADLGRWIEGEPIAASPVSTMGRLMRKAHKRRAVVVPSAIAIVLAALLAAWAIKAHRTQQRAKAEKQVRDEAARLLEAARPAFQEARLYLYVPGARYEELQSRVKKAKDLIEQSIAMWPESAAAHDLLGQAWKLLGWEDRAEACWTEAARIEPQYAPAHYHLGSFYLEHAIVCRYMAQAARDANAGEAGASGEKLSASASQQSKAMDFIRRARTELKTAVGLLEQDDDELARALLDVAEAYVLGQDQEAVRQAGAALARLGERPGCERLHLLLAMEQQDAARQLDAALRICPGDALALVLRGIEHFDRKEYDKGLEEISAASRVNPRVLEMIGDAIKSLGIESPLLPASGKR